MICLIISSVGSKVFGIDIPISGKISLFLCDNSSFLSLRVENQLFIHLKSLIMRRGINKVTLVGNVGDDPKVNQINDDLKVARFPLATNELYLDKEGNHVQKTQWHTVVVWNKVAGIIEEYVKKGDPLYVETKSF